MNHPFLKDKQLLTVYAAIWFLVAIIHFVFIYLTGVDSWYMASLDSLVFNVIFFFIGLSMWYPCEYYRNKESKTVNLIINHLSVMVFAGFVWIGASYNILILLSDEDEAYRSFLYDSLLFRGISGIFYYSIVLLIYYILSYYQNLQEKISNEGKLRELLRTAELNYLKSQINPHFLFNSLNSISSLTLSMPEKARDMIILLSDFLRYVVSQPENKPVPLKHEIENIKRYLEIEKVRFGEKLEFVFNIPDDCLNTLIPVLILQPLYENAVKHGVYESVDPITIHTEARFGSDWVEIKISNNYENFVVQAKGAGIGIKNIRERLRLMFNNPDLLSIKKEDNIFEVLLKIPQ